MKTRVLTGIVLAVLFASVLLLSHNIWFLRCIIAMMCITAIWELYSAAGLIQNKPLLWISFLLAALISFGSIPATPYFTLVIFLGMILLSIWLMRQVGLAKRLPIWATLSFTIGMVLLYNTVPSLRQMENGLNLLILALLTTVITDIGAYFTGSAIGNHKLAASISPNKTKEGAIGGIFCTVFLLMTAARIADGFHVLSVNWGILLIYLILASITAEFGDLALSAIKRITGIKDYSNLFPGHGGVLDRFDSFLFVIPVTYLFAMIGR